MTWVFEASKPTPNDTPANKATPPNPSQIVLLTGDQAYEPVRTILIHTAIVNFHNLHRNVFVFGFWLSHTYALMATEN